MNLLISIAVALLALMLGTGIFFALLIGAAIYSISSIAQYVYCTMVEATQNYGD